MIDRYEILGELGRGGQGTVLDAVDPDGRRVAIKVRTIDGAARRSVSAEANVLMSLAPHPALPHVRDAFFDEERHYLVMDHVAGRDLGSLLGEAGRGFAPDRVVEWIDGVAGALHHLHSAPAPVVHRDVKPSNIVVAPNGTAVLVDLGSAGTARLPGQNTTGTPVYAAPEVAAGGALAPTADVFSLAATAFTLLEGHVPEPGLAPSAVSGAVAETIASGLSIRPDRRPASAPAFASALRAAAGVPDTTPRALLAREAELASLVRSLDTLGTPGCGAAHLIVGEPGVGKSALVAELVRAARDRGLDAVVCAPGGADAAVPYLLWRPLLERFAEDEARLDEDAARLIREIAQGGGTREHSARPPGERHAERVAAALADFLARDPCLVVLEDVHGADAASQRLLAHVAEHVARTGCVLVATTREDQRAIDALGPLPERAATLRLGGLPEDAITALVAQRFGVRCPPHFSRRLYERTEGNPFFVDEVVRALVSSGEGLATVPGALPEQLSDLLLYRLDTVSPRTRTILEAAAVVGQRFTPELVADALRATRAEVRDALSEATRAGLVVASGDRSAFVHALTRETAYASLPAELRRRLHGSIARAIEASAEHVDDELAAELAHHWCEADLDVASADHAARLALRAGEAAMDRFAWEEGGAWFERAEAVLAEFHRGRRDDLLCDVLVRLADARFAAGDARSGDDLDRAADLCRELGRGDLLAFVAQTAPPNYGVADPKAQALHQDALALLDPDDGLWRPLLLGRLALILSHSHDRDRVQALAAEADAAARRSGHPAVVRSTLVHTTLALAGPDTLGDRISLLQRIGVWPGETEAPEALRNARMVRAQALLEAGRLAEAAAAADELQEAGSRSRDPWAMWYAAIYRVLAAIIAGRLSEAEALAGEAISLGETVTPSAFQSFGGQIGTIRFEQGRMGEMLDPLRRFADDYAGIRAWRIAVAMALAESGDTVGARAELATVDLCRIPKDANWLLAMGLAAQTVAAIGDEEPARILLRELAPYADRMTTLNCAAWMGPVAHHLGSLSLLAGRRSDAVRHLEAALEWERSRGARSWEARTSLWLAHALEGCGEADARAAKLRGRGERLAKELGLGAVPISA